MTSFLLLSPQVENITDRKKSLAIGDSLDRFMSLYVCQIWGGTFHGLETVNRLERRRQPAVCRSNDNENKNHAVIRHLGYFNIFGMHRRCENGRYAEKADPEGSTQRQTV